MWLDTLAEEAAKDSYTTNAVALKQTTEENRVRRLSRCLKAVKAENRSEALSSVKVPSTEWFYHEETEKPYHCLQGALFSHSRIPMVDGGDAPFCH